MKKTIALFFTVFLFLAQAIQSVNGVSLENAGLNPPTRIGDASFRQLCSTLCIAVTIYKLDAIEGHCKDAIIREHGKALASPGIRFDLEKIDMGKKGWTRYYPVMVGSRQLIARVFLTKERAYQPQLPVLYEMTIQDPAVTCQVLPDINSIIGSLKIKPITISLASSVSSSL
jgi:hypothetical protein